MTASLILGHLADILTRLNALEESSTERHTALLDAVGNIRVEPQDSGQIDAAIRRIDALATRTAGAGLRYVWFKAALWTSGVWLLLMTTAIFLLLNPDLVPRLFGG